MELLSKEILDQIRPAKAEREAAKAGMVDEKSEATEDEEYSNFNPIRDIEVDADPEMEGNRGMWKASW